MFDKEMLKALEKDGEYLRQMTGEDHGPFDVDEHALDAVLYGIGVEEVTVNASDISHNNISIEEFFEGKEELIDLLCLADQTIMELNGCFPLGHTPFEKRLRDTCRLIREVTGDDYEERKRRAEVARTSRQ